MNSAYAISSNSMLLEKVIAILAIQITNYMYAMIATVYYILLLEPCPKVDHTSYSNADQSH